VVPPPMSQTRIGQAGLDKRVPNRFRVHTPRHTTPPAAFQEHQVLQPGLLCSKRPVSSRATASNEAGTVSVTSLAVQRMLGKARVPRAAICAR